RLPLLLSLFLPSIFSLNILMYVNVIGKSHLQFAENLIKLLNENGHTVDVVAGVMNSLVTLKGDYGARQLVSVRFPDDPWGAAATHISDPFEEMSDWTLLKLNTFRQFSETTEKLCDLLLNSAEIAELLSTNKYDIALINGYDLCPFAIAYHHKISPVVSYLPTHSFFIQSYYGGQPELPLYDNIVFEMTRYDGKSTFAARVYETVRVFKQRYIDYHHRTVMNAKFRAHFGANFPDGADIAMNTSLDFTNSHQLLDEPVPVSARMRYIGGIGVPKPKKLNKDFDDLLNLSKKGTVIFSFGTQIGPQRFSKYLQQVIVNTFKRFPEFTFLWKFDGKTPTNATNVINLEWLPQTDLLHDSRVVAFISHMGLNSFTETSFAGVPMVAIPFFSDQVHNAQRAVTLGTAAMVRKSEITEENLTNALKKMLYDEGYRNRAQELAAKIRALPETPQRVFLESIEFAAKFKNLASHYRLAGANHHFLVQTGWDVAAFFTCTLLLLSYIAIKVVFFVIRKALALVRGKSKVE
ncbi:hypothetical protein PMAYCL1PPCAC_20150, partial [Pristionchus mayeri]